MGTVYLGTASATITPSGTATGTVIPVGFPGAINELGSVQSTDAMTVYVSGGTIPAYDLGTNRSISIAGSMGFKTPASYGQAILLGDRVEFGYKGHQAFYGWVYSIDKSDKYIYQITAYDGGYGLAQVVSNSANIPITSTLSTSYLLSLFALQVVGLGSTGLDHLGVNYSLNVVDTIFGWGFASGQVLQKLETIMLGSGYLSVVDNLSNLTLTSYQVVDPASIATIIAVGTITLRENTDNFVVQSKMFNPATQYGNWEVEGISSLGATLMASAGSSKPFRIMGGSWLLVPGSSVAQLTTFADEYQNIFQNGVWTVTAWSPFWFDTSGVDIGGSVSSYVGDGPYLLTCGSAIGAYVISLASKSVVATLVSTICYDGAFVRSSFTDQFCVVHGGTNIAEIGGLMVAAPTIEKSIGSAGTLSGDSIVYDGLNTLYTAVSGGTVYATNWYTSTSSAIATLAATLTSLLSPAIGSIYVGTSAGVVLLNGSTVTGTSAYSVTNMFADSALGRIYVCTGGTLIPYFSIGGSSVSGTIVTSTAVSLGVARSDGSGQFYVADAVDTRVFGYTSGGTVLGTLNGTIHISDLTWIDTMSWLAVTGCGTVALSIGTTVEWYTAVGPTFIGVGTVTLRPSTLVAVVNDSTARTTSALLTQQNLYTLQFADGTTLYNAIVATVQATQSGVTITFQSGQSVAGVFNGPTDTTQLSLWNVLNTSQT